MSEHEIVESEPPGQISKPVNHAPLGATDTHFHIFGPVERYPLSPRRLYNPCLSTVSEYRKLAQVVDIQRMVIVQASIYGTDNSCMIDAIEEFGFDCARGIAVVDETVQLKDIAYLHSKGIRGIRFNAITGVTPLDLLPKIAALIEPFGWHIQLWIKAERLLAISSLLKDFPVDIVLDHMAQVPLDRGFDDPLVSNVFRLQDTGRCWLKLTNYRISTEPAPYRDADEVTVALIRNAPERCVWGSDWPHIYLEGRPMPDAGVLFDNLYRWCDPHTAKKILVYNPAKLYGFDDPT
jgi:predicted TIM-barrel fold metal-dependent hydrolase